MTKEISRDRALAVRPKSESSGLEMKATLDFFNIKVPTLNAPISTNNVFTFKLTIEDYLKSYSGLI